MDNDTAPKRIKTRARPTRFPWKATVVLPAGAGAQIDRLSNATGGRGEMLRLCVEAGLPIVKERLRARDRRSTKA